MRRRQYIVLRMVKDHEEQNNNHSRSYDHEHTHEHQAEEKECEVPEQMGKGYDEYVAANGEHFNRKLFRAVCAMMVNRDKSDKHYWTDDDIMKAVQAQGLSINPKYRYDMAYLANMYYSDFYGSSVTNESQCVKMAHDIVTDPDGVEGDIFQSWLGKAINRKLDIDWTKFI